VSSAKAEKSEDKDEVTKVMEVTNEDCEGYSTFNVCVSTGVNNGTETIYERESAETILYGVINNNRFQDDRRLGTQQVQREREVDDRDCWEARDCCVSHELQEAHDCQVARGQSKVKGLTGILGGLEPQQSLGTTVKTGDGNTTSVTIVRKDKKVSQAVVPEEGEDDPTRQQGPAKWASQKDYGDPEVGEAMNTASMNLNTVCEPPRSTEQVGKAWLELIPNSTSTGSKIIGKLDFKDLMKLMKPPKQVDEGRMKLDVDKIKEYIELKEVNKRGTIVQRKRRQDNNTPEVAWKRLDQEQGETGDGVVKVPKTADQPEVSVTVQYKESNPQPQKPPIGTCMGAQQRLGQNEDVV